MKKINLFLSVFIIALVLLVVGGATVAPAVQMQSLSLNTASTTGLKGKILFDSKGRYVMDRGDLTVGSVYQFFGYDWRLVIVNGDTATFWMVDPFAVSIFNQTYRSGMGIYKDGANIWTNGYSKTVWESSYTSSVDGGKIELKESDIRKFLRTEAISMLDGINYKNKVIAGAVEGNNESNADAKKLIKYLCYSEQSLDQVDQDNITTNQLTAYYDLDENDCLWLPSKGDLRKWGILDNANNVINENMIKWTETSISSSVSTNRAWLRDPYTESSEYADTVTVEGGLSYKPVKQTAGVRPAIHLSIADISEEYEDHLNNPDGKGSWWDDDWLKALFMTVCILGVVGIGMVIVAVIVKVRRAK